MLAPGLAVRSASVKRCVRVRSSPLAPDFRTISNPGSQGACRLVRSSLAEPQLVAGAICLLSFVAVSGYL